MEGWMDHRDLMRTFKFCDSQGAKFQENTEESDPETGPGFTTTAKPQIQPGRTQQW